MMNQHFSARFANPNFRHIFVALFIFCSATIFGSAARAATKPSVAEVSRLIVCQCPDCGKQTVDQCAPGCAEGQKWRATIAQQIDKGQSSAQVVSFIADQSGEHMLATPRAQGFGIAAYALPAMFVLLALIPLAWVLRSRRPTSRVVATNASSSTRNGEESRADAPRGDDPRVAAALREFDF